MLPSRRAHALPDRTSKARRPHADLVIGAPSTPGQECDRDHEQPSALLARRPDHLRRRRLLPVQVAVVAELAVRPVVAGAAGPALTAADRALRLSVSCRFPPLSPSKIRRGRGGGPTSRTREEIARLHTFHRPCQAHLERQRRGDGAVAAPGARFRFAASYEEVVTGSVIRQSFAPELPVLGSGSARDGEVCGCCHSTCTE